MDFSDWQQDMRNQAKAFGERWIWLSIVFLSDRFFQAFSADPFSDPLSEKEN